MSLDAKKAAFILHNRSRFNAYTAETKHFTSQDPSLDRSAKNLRALRKRLLAMGPLSAPEKQILDLIPEHIILQTASPHLGELNRTDTPLKSASTRTVASDSMHNIRTPNYHGRRHYNYFVAGVGIHPNTRSLRGEDTAYIKLSHLSQKNPIFLRYFFMSPHLSDLEYSRQWGPVVLAETTFVINFNKASNSIQYTFSSKTNGEKSLVFHASELTFAGV
ncbi:MAG: hypothetical protein K0R48_1435, partial [Gammaproteobacteria bacterium]|nr:hypothetical protein [Gammaproteobacteria bacterium]